MIRDIMVANPQSAKDDSILIALDNRINPMPDSMYAQILEGADFLGSKELLENSLAWWKQKRQLCLNSLIQFFISDTIHPWALDSLVALLEDESTLSAKFILLSHYLENRQFGKADTLLQNIPVSLTLSSTEIAILQRYDSLLAVLKQIYTDTLGYTMPDSLHTVALQQLAIHQKDYPGAFARNVLIAFGLMEYSSTLLFSYTTSH